MIYFQKYHAINLEDWQAIDTELSNSSQPPIYLMFIHDAEERNKIGDYNRAVLDLAIACETFMRFEVLQTLPTSLSPKLVDYIEKANIHQYRQHFFPEILREDAIAHFKKINKQDLTPLFRQRNVIVHMGKDVGLEQEHCLRYLGATRELISLRESSE